MRLLLMMHVLVVVAESHRIDGIIRSGYNTALQDFLGRRAMRPRSRLRCVGKRQPGGVDDTVTPHQRYGNLFGTKNRMSSINLEKKKTNGMKMQVPESVHGPTANRNGKLKYRARRTASTPHSGTWSRLPRRQTTLSNWVSDFRPSAPT